MRIDYKNLDFIHQMLRGILAFVEDTSGLEFTMTSQYRIGDPGVHGQLPLRGIDLRMRSHRIGEEIARWVNENFIYDPDRPELKCAVLHGKGFKLHLHLQVHANTERIMLT